MAKVVSYWYLGILTLLPILVAAQIQPPPALKVLTVDEILQQIGVQRNSSDFLRIGSGIANGIGSRIVTSKGGEVLQQIKDKTGVDIPKFLNFVFQISVYLFLQIYAVLSDIATHLSAAK